MHIWFTFSLNGVLYRWCWFGLRLWQPDAATPLRALGFGVLALPSASCRSQHSLWSPRIHTTCCGVHRDLCPSTPTGMADSVSDFPPQIVACGNLVGLAWCLGEYHFVCCIWPLQKGWPVILRRALLMLTAANTREDFPCYRRYRPNRPRRSPGPRAISGI